MQEINLYDLLKFYAKKWFYILICAYIGLSIGLAYNFFVQEPAFQSQASLLISGTGTDSNQQKVTINNYMQLLKSRRVLEPVINKINLPYNYNVLVGKVSTSNQKDTDVIVISVANGSPEEANKIANQVIESFKEQAKELYKTGQIQVIDGASTPNQPYNVRKGMQLLLFTGAGLLFAIISLFFVYDYRLNTVGKSSTGVSEVPKEFFVAKFIKKYRRRKTIKQSDKISKNSKTAVAVSSKPLAQERNAKTGRYVSGNKKTTKKAVKNKRKK